MATLPLYASGLKSKVATLMALGLYCCNLSISFPRVMPVSTISSRMITVRPSMFSVSPMSCSTFPVVWVPWYEASLMNETSHGKLIRRIKSAIKMKEPLRMLIKMGFSSLAKSLLMALPSCSMLFLISWAG